MILLSMAMLLRACIGVSAGLLCIVALMVAADSRKSALLPRQMHADSSTSC